MLGRSIWDFTDYDTKTLKAILKHLRALEKLGMEQDEDMLGEIVSELDKRNQNKNKITS